MLVNPVQECIKPDRAPTYVTGCENKCGFQYTGKCELLCLEKEDDPLYCYCPK
jgi:hypothetical protein